MIASRSAPRRRLADAVRRALETPIVPVIVAVVLGVVTIGNKSIWLDEAYSINVARLPTIDLLVFMWHFELHAAPYYLLLQPWLALGDSEAVVRSLSIVFGVVAVLATYAIGKRYGVAFWAATLLAAFPYFIAFEQQAREYTLLAAWSAISTLAYLRFTEQPTRIRAVVYIAAGAAMIYVHPIGALVIGAHAVATFLFAPHEHRLRWLALYVPIVVAWVPMFRFMLLHRDKIFWIPPLSAPLAVEYLVTLAGGVALAVVIAVLLLVGVRRDVIASWVVVSVIGVIVMSVFIQPMFQARYLIGILPAVAIMVARTRLIGIAAVLLLSIVAVANWYLYGERDDWRSGAAWVASQAVPTDGMAFAPHYVRLPFAYYAKVGEPLYPSVPWEDRYLPGMGLYIDIPDVVDNPRIWLIEELGYHVPAEVAEELGSYATVDSRTFGPTGPVITLLVRLPST